MMKIRRLLWVCLAIPLLFTTIPAAHAQSQREPDYIVVNAKKEFPYYGSRKSNIFHRPDCRYAKRIKSGNVVGFRSREEAVSAGYVPCKVCNP